MARTKGRRTAQRSARVPRGTPAPAARRRAEPSTDPRGSSSRLLVALALGALAFVLYVLTADRDIFPGDSAEFTTVALTTGVAHPPGYPLLSVLAAIFGLLPLDPLPLRVNLVSVVSHAATVGVVFLIGERLTRNMLASVAAALVLAFGALFWAWSLVIEAFPLNDLLAVLVLYCLVLWHERPSSHWAIFAAATAFGLGVANHQTITLLLPGFAAIVLHRRRELRGRSRLLWQAAGIAVLAAIVPYAYVPFAAGRHSILNWGGVQTPLDLVRQFLRLDYGTGQLIPNAQYQGGAGIDRLVDFARHVNPILAACVAIGVVSAWQRTRWLFWAAVLMFLLAGPAFVAYANANVADNTARAILARFYLLPQVVIAPVAAVGLDLVGAWLRRQFAAPRWLPTAVASVTLALVALESTLMYRDVDRSGDHIAHDFAMDIFSTAPENSVILASGDHVILPLDYIQAVEHVRPDVTVIAIPLLPFDWYQRELKLRHPELNLPLARYDASDGLKVLIQANQGRPFAMTGEQFTQSFGGVYGVYGRGLLLPVVDPVILLDLSDLKSETERLLASYRIPPTNRIAADSFERFILDFYALVPYRLGRQFEGAKQYAEARTWYQRSLGIQPELPESIAAMKRIEGK